MDLDSILKKWDNSKAKMKKLEKNIEKYKKAIARLMRERNEKKIISRNYSIEKRSVTRRYVSRDNIPKDVWEKYSVSCTYDSYHLKKYK